MSSRLLTLLSLSVFSACAVEGDDPATFGTGSLEELSVAEDMAYDQLFTAGGVADLKAVDQLRTMSVKIDDLDMAHTRVQQLVNDVPVWGGEAIVHFDDDGSLFGVTDDLVPDVFVDTTPDFTADEAIEAAVEDFGAGWESITDDPTADLWIIRQDGLDHLAWRVTMHELDAAGIERLPVRFIDAHDGTIAWEYDNLQSATCSGTTNFYGTVSFNCYTDGTTYYSEDTTDLLGTYTWNHTTTSLYYVSSTSTTFATDSVTKNAVEAHYVANATHDFYQTTYGRNGIDGVGGPAYITSHGYNFITSTSSYANNYVNAGWDPTYLFMLYGDGDGVNSNSLTTLDIGGHEMTHGVTQYESNLTYSGESGGINEALSDIFGAMVERYVSGASANNWMMGEETWTPGTAGDALRYMNDPAADGFSYDYYTSTIGSADVHYSSGVANLAFYLLSEGGTHPRGRSTTVVTGIGADAAAAIFYLANTTYMTSSTNYSGLRTATLSAAAALYGSSSNEYTQVGNAWTAVGVSGTSTTCTTTSYSGSFSRRGRTNYHPSSSGTSVTVASQTVALTGPSGTDFDLYLDKVSGRSWVNVASDTSSSVNKSISYSGTSGTYRVRAYSATGTGSYTVAWCK